MNEDATPTKAMHVLVVDGDPCIRQLAIDCLEDSGIRVSSASTEAAMLRILNQQSIDLLVLDVNLPGSDCMALTRKICKDSNMPIVFLILPTQEGVQFNDFAPLFSACLTKPFSPNELIGRINDIMHQSTPAELALKELSRIVAYRFAEWELNLRTRRLMAPSGAIVLLTSTEFKLLATFLACSKLLLSRDGLLAAADLPDSENAHDEALDLHISRLRKKINPMDSSADYIVQGPCRGYRFTVDSEAKSA